jgi:hypothetical protein
MYCFRETSNFPFSNQKIITLIWIKLQQQGDCKTRNETETKRNKQKRKRNETQQKQNKIKQKRNETKRNETRHNRNETKPKKSSINKKNETNINETIFFTLDNNPQNASGWLENL